LSDGKNWVMLKASTLVDLFFAQPERAM